MSAKNIEKAIIKYLTHEADSDDLDILSKWIQVPENEAFFENFVKTHYKITLAMSNPNVNEIKKNLLEQIKTDQNKVHKLKIRRTVIQYSAAAILVIALALTYLLKDNLFAPKVENTVEPVIVDTKLIKPGSDKAILTLEDGSFVELEKGNSFQTQNASTNGEEIIYKKRNEENFELVFNYLTVPRGGQFFLELSDGTKVWLNSESQLKYPVNFREGETRVVELVYGEGYFEVSPSTQHNGSIFKVFHKSQEIVVLGTEFNIKAYNDEVNIYTTLVEGKVAISYEDQKAELIPGQQSNLNLENKGFSINKVDVDVETSWRKGIFTFKEKSLKDVMKVISRWYDAEIIFENKNLETLKFKGVLGKNQSIEEILSIMKSTSINNYEINGRIIILK